MKVFLVERPQTAYNQDYAIAVIAKDKLHALNKAKEASIDFATCEFDITVTEFDTNVEQCVLIANTGD